MERTAGAFEEAARHDTNRFIGRWIAFNAVYKQYFSGSERDQMACIQNSIPNVVADAVLNSLQPEITFLANLPPGDMRFRSDPKRFRVRSTDDLRTVCDTSRTPTDRLAHLVAVVYQVRCNLFHGEKNPTHLRDHQLIRAGDRILRALLDALV